jgi:hypothetical protein
MKKFVSVLLVFVFVFSALNVSAKTYTTKEAALAGIEKAIEDPEIKEWVNENVGNDKLFMKAVKLAPEETVIKIANSFSDFQEHGGEINLTKDDLVIVSLVLLGIIVLAIVL